MASHDRRQLVYIPEIEPTTFLLFFEKRLDSEEWSVRDYQVPGQVRTRYGHEFGWKSTEALARAQFAFPAPVVAAGEGAFWEREIRAKNREYLDFLDPERAAANPRLFPVLDYAELLRSPKGRRVLELKRLLESPKSEDWLLWNFFHLAARQGLGAITGHWPNGEALVLPLGEAQYWPEEFAEASLYFAGAQLLLEGKAEAVGVTDRRTQRRTEVAWANLARPWLHQAAEDALAEKVRQEVLRRIDPRRSPKAA